MRQVLRTLFDLIGAFFAWWLRELASLLPPPLKRLFKSGGERYLLEMQDGEPRLYRLKGRKAEPVEIGVNGGGKSGKPATVALALPASQAATREAELPLATEENLRQVLGFEMDRLSPFSQADVYFDYKILKRDAKRERLKLSIFLSPRPKVDALIAKAEQRGFAVNAVDVSCNKAGQTLGVNLLPRTAAPRPSRTGRLLAGALTATAAVLLFLAVQIPFERKALYAEALNQRVAVERARVTALRKLEKEIATLQDQGGSMQDHKRADTLTLALVDQVTRLLPDDVWLIQLSLAGDRLQLSGFSPASSKLLTTFEESPMFGETVFRAPVTQDPRLGLERFSLSLRVIPAGPKP